MTDDFHDYTTKVLGQKVKDRGLPVPRTKAERVALLIGLAYEDKAKTSKVKTDAVPEVKTTTDVGTSVTECITYARALAVTIVWYLVVVTLVFALLLILAWPAAKLGLPLLVIKGLPGVYAWLVVPGLAVLASFKVIRDIVGYTGLFR